MISIQFTVGDREENKRIDKVIVERYPNYSRSLIQKLITDGNIVLNEMKIKPNYKCAINDHIEGYIQTKQQIQINPENIPLDIKYEDDDLIIVNKTKGMVV